MQAQATEQELNEIEEMSRAIVSGMKSNSRNPPINICLSALAEVMIDICQYVGLDKLGFVDLCKELIDVYGDFPNGTDTRTA